MGHQGFKGRTWTQPSIEQEPAGETPQQRRRRELDQAFMNAAKTFRESDRYDDTDQWE